MTNKIVARHRNNKAKALKPRDVVLGAMLRRLRSGKCVHVDAITIDTDRKPPKLDLEILRLALRSHGFEQAGSFVSAGSVSDVWLGRGEDKGTIILETSKVGDVHMTRQRAA